MKAYSITQKVLFIKSEKKQYKIEFKKRQQKQAHEHNTFKLKLH
jgi:hypothetical protein